jgi:hypothetical protein
MITQELANELHPQKQIYVAAWWCKDKRAVLCEITEIHRCDKYKVEQWWNPPTGDPDRITHVTVKPLTGNSHSRFVSVFDIIS